MISVFNSLRHDFTTQLVKELDIKAQFQKAYVSLHIHKCNKLISKNCYNPAVPTEQQSGA